MKWFKNIVKASFTSRPNRFIIHCDLNNRPVKAYLPNPGKLWELLLPRCTIYLAKQSSPGSKLRYIAVAVEKDGRPVMLHTHVNNQVARHLIENNYVEGLKGASIVRPEFPVGKSRFDFLMRKGKEEILLEVKSCTLFSGKVAMFPDAITTRGRKHLLELARLSSQSRKTAVLFIIHSPDIHYFLPEFHTDLEFSRTLLSVSDKVMIKAVSIGWTKDLNLKKNVTTPVIPWDLIAKEADDRGCYIVILRINKTSEINIGSLGPVTVKKGFYLYAGSAKKNLTRRIERHRRMRKNLFWHIDYLREKADFTTAIPIRSSENLECGLAAALNKISEWNIPAFGSSDCSCSSHLFGMSSNPLHLPSFIKTLLNFRIDRLEDLLRS